MAMSESDIRKLIASGEGNNLEFKQSIPSKALELAEEICAFVNAAGGTILIGVNDKGEIVGVTFDNEKRSRLQNIIGNINPAVDVQVHTAVVDGKPIVCLACPSGNKKPYLVSGSMIVRNGPNSEKITSAERMRDFFQRADRLFFDEAPAKDFTMSLGFDESLFRNFLIESGLSTTLPTHTLIHNLQLFARPNEFKNAAVLFFSATPEKWFPHAVIRCVLFKGVDKTNIIDDKTITGPLHAQYVGAISYLRQKLNLEYQITDAGPRREVLEVPEVALREALVNAMGHRDYYEKGAVTMVEIFDDRVVITNPGGLVHSIDRAEFGFKSMSRNPLLFGLLQRMRLVEKIGSGIGRIRTAMQAAGLPPPLFSLEGMFTITFRRPVTNFNQWLDGVTPPLTDMQARLLRCLYGRPGATNSDIARELNVPLRTVQRNIKALRDRGLLAREGSDKSGRYTIQF